MRYGRDAAEALRAEIVAAKGAEPLAPVTVVVPSNHVGVAARRLLASGASAPPPRPRTASAWWRSRSSPRTGWPSCSARRSWPAGPPAGVDAGASPPRCARRCAPTPGMFAPGRRAPRHRDGARRRLPRAARAVRRRRSTRRRARRVGAPPTSSGSTAPRGPVLETDWYDEQDLMAAAAGAVGAATRPRATSARSSSTSRSGCRATPPSCSVRSPGERTRVGRSPAPPGDDGADAEVRRVARPARRRTARSGAGGPQPMPTVPVGRRTARTIVVSVRRRRRGARGRPGGRRRGPRGHAARPHRRPLRQPRARTPGCVHEHLAAAGIADQRPGRRAAGGAVAGRTLLDLLRAARASTSAARTCSPGSRRRRCSSTAGGRRSRRGSGCPARPASSPAAATGTACSPAFADRERGAPRSTADEADEPPWWRSSAGATQERGARAAAHLRARPDRRPRRGGRATPAPWSEHAAWAHELRSTDLLGAASAPRRRGRPAERKAAERVERRSTGSPRSTSVEAPVDARRVHPHARPRARVRPRPGRPLRRGRARRLGRRWASGSTSTSSSCSAWPRAPSRPRPRRLAAARPRARGRRRRAAAAARRVDRQHRELLAALAGAASARCSASPAATCAAAASGSRRAGCSTSRRQLAGERLVGASDLLRGRRAVGRPRRVVRRRAAQRSRSRPPSRSTGSAPCSRRAPAGASWPASPRRSTTVLGRRASRWSTRAEPRASPASTATSPGWRSRRRSTAARRPPASSGGPTARSPTSMQDLLADRAGREPRGAARDHAARPGQPRPRGARAVRRSRCSRRRRRARTVDAPLATRTRLVADRRGGVRPLRGRGSHRPADLLAPRPGPRSSPTSSGSSTTTTSYRAARRTPPDRRRAAVRARAAHRAVPFPLPDGRRCRSAARPTGSTSATTARIHVVDYKTGKPVRRGSPPGRPRPAARGCSSPSTARPRASTSADPTPRCGPSTGSSRQGRVQARRLRGHARGRSTRVGATLGMIVDGIEAGVFASHPHRRQHRRSGSSAQSCDPDGLGTTELRRAVGAQVGRPRARAGYAELAEPPRGRGAES